MTLRLDWCSHQAAKWAVEHWHYSHSLPTPPYNRVGVWEDERFIGVVLFSRGANNNIGKPYGLETTAVCELTRVALTTHHSPVTRIVALALRFLQCRSPGLRLCVSYADPNQGHIGTIYQAGNWLYVGRTSESSKYVDQSGREWHQRQVSASGIKPQYGQLRTVAKISECRKVPQLGKYRYLMPLDAAMRVQLLPLAKPYPRRQPLESEGTGSQPDQGAAMRPDGSILTEVS